MEPVTRDAEPAAAVPAPGAAGRRRLPAGRVVPAAVAGLLALLALGLSTGLLLGSPVGAGDNGDGARLWCGAGLVPRTPDGSSSWKGGVVLDFTTGAPACDDPLPSSALDVLRAVTPAGPGTWSLTTLGWTYLGVAVVAAAVAGWAASARGPWRATLLAAPLLPAAEPAFGRFLISTFSEPAGLVGVFVLLVGVVTVAVTRRDDRAERTVGLVLVAVGGVLAATAKTGYVPVLAAAVLVCLVTPVGPRGRRGRVPGTVMAVALVAVAVGPIVDTADWQARHYATVNTVDVVFTTVLPEVGHTALGPLGLPADAAQRSGQAYFPAPTRACPAPPPSPPTPTGSATPPGPSWRRVPGHCCGRSGWPSRRRRGGRSTTCPRRPGPPRRLRPPSAAPPAPSARTPRRCAPGSTTWPCRGGRRRCCSRASSRASPGWSARCADGSRRRRPSGGSAG
ncbi:hypothetical protein ACFQV8_08350 [Pseudonocardia benzenivorans]